MWKKSCTGRNFCLHALNLIYRWTYISWFSHIFYRSEHLQQYDTTKILWSNDKKTWLNFRLPWNPAIYWYSEQKLQAKTWCQAPVSFTVSTIKRAIAARKVIKNKKKCTESKLYVLVWKNQREKCTIIIKAHHPAVLFFSWLPRVLHMVEGESFMYF